MTKQAKLYDADGIELSTYSTGILWPGTKVLGDLSVENTGDEALTEIRLGVMTSDGHWGTNTDAKGFEIMTEKFLEMRLDPLDDWTPVGGSVSSSANYLSVGALAVGISTPIYVRMNIPSDVETSGSFNIKYALFWR
jgi:hypothetical protein